MRNFGPSQQWSFTATVWSGLYAVEKPRKYSRCTRSGTNYQGVTKDMQQDLFKVRTGTWYCPRPEGVKRSCVVFQKKRAHKRIGVLESADGKVLQVIDG